MDNALASLIEEDYLNEERFAVQFAGGKFRIKGWGRTRIKNELKQTGEYNMKIFLCSDYEKRRMETETDPVIKI